MNGPIQQRMMVLTKDLYEVNRGPNDRIYQEQMSELKSQLTSALNIHLNVNQSYHITSPTLLHSFHKLSIDSLTNQSFLDDRIRFPASSSSINMANASKAIRVRFSLSVIII